MPMFADSLCDSTLASFPRRTWTTLMSFGVQAVGVGIMLLIPLIYTEGLPALRWMTAPLPTPAPFVAEAPALEMHNAGGGRSELSHGILVQPPDIRSVTLQVDNRNVLPAPPDAEIGPGPGGPIGSPNGVFNSIYSASTFVPPLPPKPTARPPRISIMMEGNLIHRVQPTYPPLAKAAGIQGTVVLRAVISKEGTIENLTVQSGPPLLVKAALEAVAQWRYRPYLLNGDPFEVETQVTVNFVLNR
jgi:periplasmic protein TonB